jgi:hypothetical protein
VPALMPHARYQLAARPSFPPAGQVRARMAKAQPGAFALSHICRRQLLPDSRPRFTGRLSYGARRPLSAAEGTRAGI